MCRVLANGPLRPLGTSPNLGEERGCWFTTRALSLGRKVDGALLTRAKADCFHLLSPPQVRGSTRRGRESVLCAVWLFQFVTSRKLLLYRPLRPLGTSPNLGEEGGCGFTTRARPWGGMVMCTSTTRAQLWVGKVNYTILPFAACHVVMRLSLCCHVIPVRHKLCKIGIANQNN